MIQRFKHWIIQNTSPCLVLLVPFSCVWMLVTKCRRWLYLKKIFSSYRASVPLISIGNITSGGTGKTPCIDLILNRLTKVPVAVVSRGYGAQLKTPCVVALGKDIDVEHDETRLLARHHKNVLFALSRNKQDAVQAVEGRVQLILLDDGFQHLQLDRQLDIVVINGEQPLGNGYLLPRGLLRESPQALRAASLIILNYANEKARQEVRKWTNAPIVSCKPVINSFTDAHSGGQVPTPQKVALVSAIGSPESFQKTVEESGIQVVQRLDFADHARIDQAELAQLDELEIDAIVITEKDWVRQPLQSHKHPLLVANMQLKILDGEQHLDAIL